MGKATRVFVALLSFVNLAASESFQGLGDSVIVDGVWRFTAISDRLIRIEHDQTSRFVDDPTLTFLQRSKPKGIWQSQAVDGSTVKLHTSSVTLNYIPNSKPSPDSLSVTSHDGKFSWTWGDDPEVGNLRGTARTLDSSAETLDLNCHNKVSPTMDNSEMHCAWGLISKKGWAIVDDTGAPTWKDSWFAASERNSTDVYIFLHGLDFKGSLQDFFYAAGAPALPPRYAFGTIFTRWFDFDSDSTKGLINDFESRSMPLDAWIFDMNWHLYGPWGSYTWNSNSFPDLQNVLDWFQAKGLPIGANTHDNDWFTPKEKSYSEVCKALGCTFGENIAFDLYNKTYALTMEDIAVRALDTKDGKQGIDFYWIDYQQGESDKFKETQIPKVNPTIALNMLRSMDPARHGDNKRSLILSRWGGLGSHRYPVGFSGDQLHDWKGLAFLPYFTSTAANVAFNYWSHDTVGGDHDLASDYELSARWVQVSAWSPVLRFHDKGAGTGNCATNDECARVVPWDLPNQYFQAVREASQRRAELIPYIYTASFMCIASGEALVRPMYYDDPTDDGLYGLDRQYLFGPDMVISPITQPSGPETRGFNQALGAQSWSVFAPKSSRWVDRLNGDFAQGQWVTRTYGILDVPGFVREGAVIPMRPTNIGQSSLAQAKKSLDEVEFRVYPALAFYTGGQTKGSGTVIDDDGFSTDYLQGKYTSTTCEYDFDTKTFTVRLSQEGDFLSKPAKVTLRLSFPQLPPLALVSASRLQLPTVSYDHHILGPVFTFYDVDLLANPSVTFEIPEEYSSAALQNFIGTLGRHRRAMYVKDALDALNTNYGDDRADLTSYVLAGVHMDPAFAVSLQDLWQGASSQVAQLLAKDNDLNKDPRRSTFIKKLMADDEPAEAIMLVV